MVTHSHNGPTVVLTLPDGTVRLDLLTESMAHVRCHLYQRNPDATCGQVIETALMRITGVALEPETL